MTPKAQAITRALSALQRPIREFPDLIHLAPPVTNPDNSINDVVVALSRNPSARTVFVTDAADRLLGSISERELDLDLITLVLPQQLWSEIREWDRRELMRAAHGNARTARDLMTRVEALTPDKPLREALTMMSHRKDSVVPLVDDHERLLGYLTLFETLALLMKTLA